MENDGIPSATVVKLRGMVNKLSPEGVEVIYMVMTYAISSNGIAFTMKKLREVVRGLPLEDIRDVINSFSPVPDDDLKRWRIHSCMLKTTRVIKDELRQKELALMNEELNKLQKELKAKDEVLKKQQDRLKQYRRCQLKLHTLLEEQAASIERISSNTSMEEQFEFVVEEGVYENLLKKLTTELDTLEMEMGKIM
ncbi:hypothetical protein GQ43DRAFT_459809 [Delitschia confertaspora ATCC 74209]|uniref:Uncharacterized protein n=1 Tax=Delitschia confertaspora ATCC 74209 TaxID=1513339 RepID=A0A9P4JYP9_9PLEO|nr:hypothetical protein GQ43DRAFT_459809 [Delitschia confertaspora ATCC 74209]